MAQPIPFRSFGSKGIIKDQNPYDLPPDCFSGGSNVRFENDKALRSPVFRRVSGLTGVNPMFCYGQRPTAGFDSVVYATEDGHVYSWSSGSEVDITPLGFTPSVSVSTPYTASLLGNVLYINRAAGVPYHKKPADAKLLALPGWDATWSCRALRTFKDFVVAIHVTKGTTEFPSMVKWSDTAQYGQAPVTWDSTDTTHNAGENPLSSLDSPFLDGFPLGDNFFLYSQGQVWVMEQSNDGFIFDFRKRFSEGGILNQNCVVEVDGKHYVFGATDIYVHDGNQKSSIAAGRVKKFIYDSLNTKKAYKCFVHHDPNLNLIYFCYESGDGDVSFRNPTRCNKAAVYNYVNDTWGFMDLPNIAGMALANINGVSTYATTTLTYNLAGGSYFDQEDSFQLQIAAVCCPWTDPTPGSTRAITSSRLLGLDPMDKGSTLSFNLDTECYAPATLERIGIDLDEYGKSLNQVLTLKRMYPQVTIFRSIPLQLQVGRAMTPSGDLTWSPKASFDPRTQYKIDVKASGRYLGLRCFVDSPADFELSGFDADFGSAGKR